MVPEISCQTDRQIDTHITILRKHCRGQSNYFGSYSSCVFQTIYCYYVINLLIYTSDVGVTSYVENLQLSGIITRSGILVVVENCSY